MLSGRVMAVRTLQSKKQWVLRAGTEVDSKPMTEVREVQLRKQYSPREEREGGKEMEVSLMQSWKQRLPRAGTEVDSKPMTEVRAEQE